MGLQTDGFFELILIDDGSSDGSTALAESFAQQDPRVTLLRKPNGGVSSARNLGLSLAKGDWVLFVDADDTVEPDFVATMRAALAGNDLAICAYDSVGHNEARSFVMPKGQAVTMTQVYEHSLCSLIINGGCCNKAFRLDLIRQHGLWFDEHFSVGEDMVFLVRYFAHCSRVDYVHRILYHYTINAQSLTQSAIVQRRTTDRDASVLLAMDALAEELRTQSRQVQGFGEFRRVRSSLRLLFQMVLSGTQQPEWLAHIARHTRAGLWVFVWSPHARWIEGLTAMGIAVAPSVVFYLLCTLARFHPRWVADLRT